MKVNVHYYKFNFVAINKNHFKFMHVVGKGGFGKVLLYNIYKTYRSGE